MARSRLGLLAVVAALVAGSFTALGGPTAAFAQSETMSVSPASGPPGEVVTLSGSGFQDYTGSEIEIDISIDYGNGNWDLLVAGAAYPVPDSNGNFAVDVTIPSDAPPGDLLAISSITEPEADAFFTVTKSSVPAAPSNLAAAALNSSSIRLTWTDNSDNEVGFQINNGVTTTAVKANATSYTWGGLAPNTYMCFRIRAYNSSGSSKWDPNVSPWYVCATSGAGACPTALVVAVHGVGEGPSSTKPVSTTLKYTYGAFTSAADRQGRTGEYFDPINYTTVPVSDFGTTAGLKHVFTTVQDVASGLNTTLTGLTSACPAMSISLAGYSLGAWIINYLLITYHGLWPTISSVTYYGDPCWYSPSQGYEGLARKFVGGCADKATYPYPARTTSLRIRSWCLAKDPICGRGYDSLQPVKQLLAAKNCTTGNGCSHYDYKNGYPSSGPTVEGGDFLESHAF